MDMLGQTGVGSHGAEVSGLEEVDISPFVQLVHGDLSTMERVMSAMDRRAIDMTPEDRLQFIIFVFIFVFLLRIIIVIIFLNVVFINTATHPPA